MNQIQPRTDFELPGQKHDPLHREGIDPRQVQILVVEDDDRLRRLSCRFLESRGWRVSEASDPESGLRALEEAERDPDVIVTDVVLPGGSGPEWIAQARVRHPEILVLFVSGYGPPEPEEAATLLQHGAWLQKPYSFERLIREVGQLLAQRQA